MVDSEKSNLSLRTREVVNLLMHELGDGGNEEGKISVPHRGDRTRQLFALLLKHTNQRLPSRVLYTALYGTATAAPHAAQQIAAIMQRIEGLIAVLNPLARDKGFELVLLTQKTARSEGGRGQKGYGIAIHPLDTAVPVAAGPLPLAEPWRWTASRPPLEIALRWRHTNPRLPRGLPLACVNLFCQDDAEMYALPSALVPYREALLVRHLAGGHSPVYHDSLRLRACEFWPVLDEVGDTAGLTLLGQPARYGDFLVTNLSLPELLLDEPGRCVGDLLGTSWDDAVARSANLLHVNLLLVLRQDHRLLIPLRGERLMAGARAYGPSLSVMLPVTAALGQTAPPAPELARYFAAQGYVESLRQLDTTALLVECARREWGIGVSDALRAGAVYLLGYAQGLRFGTPVLLGYAEIDLTEEDVRVSLQTSDRWETPTFLGVPCHTAAVQAFLHGDPYPAAPRVPFLEIGAALTLQALEATADGD